MRIAAFLARRHRAGARAARSHRRGAAALSCSTTSIRRASSSATSARFRSASSPARSACIGWRDDVWPLWFPLLVFGPFIGDATLTLVRRLARGERVWQAHREHYYQRMVRMGLGHRSTASAVRGDGRVRGRSAARARQAPACRRGVRAGIAARRLESGSTAAGRWFVREAGMRARRLLVFLHDVLAAALAWLRGVLAALQPRYPGRVLRRHARRGCPG